MDIIANLKEMKNLSIPKLLVFTSLVLLILLYVRSYIPSLHNEFLDTLELFSIKLGFNDWKSILSIIQVMSAIAVIVLFVILVLSMLLYAFY